MVLQEAGAPARLAGREGEVRRGGGTCLDRAKKHPLRRLRFLGRWP